MKLRKVFLLMITFVFIFTGNIFAATVDESEILVPAAIMIETNSNKTLYEKNSNQRMYPASTTKIMTAVVVLENCTLEEQARVTYSAISTIPEGYSTPDLVVDEVFTVNDLLHLMLIESSNEAANVLAEHVAGSTESFATMMNTKAHELGCTNTNFTNPYGLHDENHYTTANDLYLITKHALQNDTFRSIVRKSLYVVYPTNKTESERKVENTNKFLHSDSKFYDKRVLGVKTGFTTPAGNCLSAYASDNGMDLIIVTLGGGLENNEIPDQQFTSTRTLINYAFDNYSFKTMYEANDIYNTVVVKNADDETKNLKILVKDEVKVFGDNDTLNNGISPNIEMKENIVAPIKAGDVLGNISYEIMGTVYTSDLIAANDVNVSPVTFIIFAVFVGILICFVLFKVFANKKKRRKRAKRYTY